MTDENSSKTVPQYIKDLTIYRLFHFATPTVALRIHMVIL